jgi:hydroxymethylbilane synthase
MTLGAFLEREDVRDAFVSLTAKNLDALPRGARFGTSSIRRAAQILRHRPDLEIVPFRGNVDTRLKKLADGVAAATLLAMAGLNRLGRSEEARSALDPRLFPPAPAQGAITLELRTGDRRTAELVAPLDHPPTSTAVRAERAMLGVLDGSCRTPIGAFSVLDAAEYTLHGQILGLDGSDVVEASLSGAAVEAEDVGRELGERLRGLAGPAYARLFGT